MHLPCAFFKDFAMSLKPEWAFLNLRVTVLNSENDYECERVTLTAATLTAG